MPGLACFSGGHMKWPKHPCQFRAVRLSVLLGSVVVLLVASLEVPAQSPGESVVRGLTHPPSVNTLPVGTKRWALLIGVDRYDDSNITPLRGAANDAHALRETLVKYAGFPAEQVVVLSTAEPAERQPTRTNVLKRLSNLAGLVPKDGLLLISFAGHGIDRQGRGFLIPSDATLTEDLGLLEETALSVNHLKRRIKDTGVQQIMILLDACRSYPTGRSNTPNPLTTGFTKAFSFDVHNREVNAFAVLYATSIGDRAYEYGEKRRGYFSWAITQALSGAASNERGEVTLRSLIKYLEDSVPKLVALEYGARTIQKPFAQIEGYRANELVVAVSQATQDAINTNGISGNVSPGPGPGTSQESRPVKTRGAKSGNIAIVFAITRGGDSQNQMATANEFIAPLTSSIFKSNAGLSVKGLAHQPEEIEKIVRELSKKSSPYALIVKSTLTLSQLAPYNGLEICEANGSVELIDTDTGKIIFTDNISRKRGFGNSHDQARRNALKTAAEGVSESFINKIAASAND
jgi:uncharacterized caspase-like protein